MRAKCSDHDSLLNSAFRSQLNIEHSSISNLGSIAQYLNGDNLLSADIRNKQVLNGLTNDFVKKVRCTYKTLSDVHISNCSKLSLLSPG